MSYHSPQCIYRNSSCFCDCHNYYSNCTTYQFRHSHCPMYERNFSETGKFPCSYSNGFEEDTMTSYTDNFKYNKLQGKESMGSLYNPENNMSRGSLKKGVLESPSQGNVDYYGTFQPRNSNGFQTNSQFGQSQQLNRPDIKELVQEDGKMGESQGMMSTGKLGSNDNESMKKSGSESLYNQSSQQFNNLPKNEEEREYLLYLENEINDLREKNNTCKDGLDLSFSFVKYIAGKENVYFKNEDFYLQNKDIYAQLLEILKESLYNTHQKDAEDKGQQKPLNSMKIEDKTEDLNGTRNMPGKYQNPNDIIANSYNQDNLLYNYNQGGVNYTYEMEPGYRRNYNSMNIAQNQDNQMIKPQNEQQKYQYKDSSNNNQFNPNQSIGKKENSNQFQESNKNNNHINNLKNQGLKEKTQMDRPIDIPQDKTMPPHNTPTELPNNNNDRKKTKNHNNPKVINPEDQPMNNNQQQQLKNIKPIPKGNNNSNNIQQNPYHIEDIYNQSFKTKPPQKAQSKQKPINNQNNNMNPKLWSGMNKNQQGMKKSASGLDNYQHNLPMDPNKVPNKFNQTLEHQQSNNKNNNKASNPAKNHLLKKADNDQRVSNHQMNDMMIREPNHQNKKGLKSGKNKPEINLERTGSLANFQRMPYNSPTKDCIACNVKCAVSITGYSPMTYSPYGDRKKRRAVTPLKNV